MIKLVNVRLLYAAALFTPQRGPDGTGEPKFSATFAFPKDHPVVAQILEGFKKVAQEKWKEKAADTYLELKAGGKLCLHDGDAKASKEGYKGNLYLSASNKLRPLVIDGLKQPLTAESGKPYSGCFVNGTIELWAQENKWGKRINASLMGVQFVKDGPRLAGGSVSSVDDYEAVPEAVEQQAASGGATAAGGAPAKPADPNDIWR